MKAVLLTIVTLVGLLFLSDFIYKTYKRHQRMTELTEDRAVIFTYIDLSRDDLKDYFSLSDTALQAIKENYGLSCDVEAYHYLHLINVRPASAIADINCREPFDFASQLEMNREYQDPAYTLRVTLTAPPSRRIIAQRDIHVAWEYGQVNHLIVTKDKAYLHCSN